MLTTGNQLKAARALIGMDQETVANRAAVNVNTVRNMESAGAGTIAGRAQNVQAVQRVLEDAGVEFLNHGQPGVRMKMCAEEKSSPGRYEPKIGDLVKYREDRPGPDLKHVGAVGRVIDPGHTSPNGPNYVYVQFPDGDGSWVDKGMLLPAA